MATKKKATRTYNVTGRVTIKVGIDVTADSLSAATEQAQEFAVSNFVEALGDVFDSDVEITGAWLNEA